MSSSVKPPRLLDRVRDKIRLKHYSIRTEQAYLGWIKRFILFHNKRHPKSMGLPEIEAFLTDLAVRGNVASSTQNQALNALVFLYKHVLDMEISELGGVVRAKRPQRLPVVLTAGEAGSILAHLRGVYWLMAALMYGSGLRPMECARRREVIVRHGKGGKDRVTMLPQTAVEPLKIQLEHARALHRKDLAEGYGAVYLPYALERKYPDANRDRGWQYVFPAGKRAMDPRSGIERRHHLHETALQQAVKSAVRASGLTKPASCHSLYHYG